MTDIHDSRPASGREFFLPSEHQSQHDMIQRIQTLFLALAVILNVAGLFLPLWSGGSGDMAQTVMGLSVESGGEATVFSEHENTTMMIAHTAYVGFTVLSSVWLLLVIFQFQNRQKQMRRTFMGMLMICLEILGLVWLTMQIQAEGAGPEYGWAAPIAALALAWLAARRIKKDDDLVRSVDRIR